MMLSIVMRATASNWEIRGGPVTELAQFLLWPRIGLCAPEVLQRWF